MAVHLSGAYLLGYSQTNNFFGDTLFRLGSTATMKVSAIIDVRPGGSDGYPGDPNTDHLGAKEAFDIINSQANNIANWQVNPKSYNRKHQHNSTMHPFIVLL